MAFYKQDIVDINLNTGSIFRSFLNHSIGFKNDDADRFGIRCFRDGEPVDLSGASCQAVFMAPNGVNIALTSYGTVSGNVAYVTLPPACYDYEGQFCLSIQLVGGGVTGTMRIVDGMVVNTGASGAVAPTASVPTYQEIIAQYTAMVAATSAANLAIAETFDATKAYPAGKYVINEGHLYRLTADHAANVTWANTSKVATNFGDDLSSLKSALKSRFNGKKLSIIGDSIDTFNQAGYKIDGYNMYYPALGVTDVNQTWWKRVMDNSGMTMEVNASWSGSRVTNTHSDPTYPDFYDRVSVIGSPDVIFVTLGTNDSSASVALGDYDFATAYASLSESTFRTAYIKGVKALKALYPSAEIVCISEKMGESYRASIEYIAKELSVDYIDASDYSGSSGVHPGVVGMDQIASLVLYPTDSGLWQKHYPADAAETGEAVNSLKSAIDFDSDFYMSEIINGDNEYNFVNYPGYLGTNGSIASQTANKEVTTNKIRVIEGQSLSVRLDYESSQQYWLVYGRYDANGNWLGRTDLKTSGSGTTYSTTIDVPSGVGYVRFSYRTYDVSTFSVKTISTYNGALSYLETGNMFDYGASELGILDPTTGIINKNTEYFRQARASNYIPATQNEKISVDLWGTPPETYNLYFNVFAYDSNKDKISRVAANTGNSQAKHIYGEYTVPANTAYIRVSAYCFYGGFLQLTKGKDHYAYMPNGNDAFAGHIKENVAELQRDKNADLRMILNGKIAYELTEYPGAIGTYGNIQPAGDKYAVYTNRISVVPGEKIILRLSYTQERPIWLTYGGYDSEGKWETRHNIVVTGNYEEYTRTITVPSGVYYILFSYWTYNESTFTATPRLKIDDTPSVGFFWPLIRPIKKRIVLHRGKMEEAPENTIPAFELAGQTNAFAIETDVIETSDGYFVLMHDNDVSRMTDGTGNITSKTYAEVQELTIDAGANIGEYPNLKIPLLEDYLKICREYGKVACIEIKNVTHYENLITLIKEMGMEGSSIIILPNTESIILRVRSITNIPVSIVLTALPSGKTFSDIVETFSTYENIFIAVEETICTESNIKTAHSKNIPIYWWSLNNVPTKERLNSAFANGADLLLSNGVTNLEA